MAGKKISIAKVAVNLPFGIGQVELALDETQQRAAWELYVELATRIALEPLGPDEGLLRESLASLHAVFAVTRDILRKAGPGVAKGRCPFGPVAIEVLNRGLRPFLAKWHPLLLAHEQKRSSRVDQRTHEHKWEYSKEFRQDLGKLQTQMRIYADTLATIAGCKKDLPKK